MKEGSCERDYKTTQPALGIFNLRGLTNTAAPNLLLPVKTRARTP